jgi:predicted phosphodiesterase
MRLVVPFICVLVLSSCANTGAERPTALAQGPQVIAHPVGDLARNTLTLPNAQRSIKFAIIGDSGRGSKEQHDVAAQMEAYRQRFDYKFVLMAGDNIYEGPASAEDYRLKFEDPYKPLLEAGVKFYAALGNHDDSNQVYYEPFNMEGNRYYTFVPPVDPITRWDTRVRFFALDSTYLDRAQSRWFEEKTMDSNAEWKIAFLHHPVYTSGRYTLAARGIRFALESAFANGGIDVVFSGHEHIYQRAELQNDILYFVTGGAGSLREGDAGASPWIARSYDRDYHFMLAEITDEGFFFQAINRTGMTVDAGVLTKPTADTPGRR